MHSGTVNSYWEQVDSCVMHPTIAPQTLNLHPRKNPTSAMPATKLQSSTMRRFGSWSQMPKWRAVLLKNLHGTEVRMSLVYRDKEVSLRKNAPGPTRQVRKSSGGSDSD